MTTMHTLRRAIVAISCAALMAGSAMAMAHDSFPSDGANPDGMLPDLFLVRPVGLVGTVLGSAVFLVALPFTLPTHTAGEAANSFVIRPFEYTFNRPLGDFDHCGATRHACGD